jgi:PAS domain S-box-containing protein
MQNKISTPDRRSAEGNTNHRLTAVQKQDAILKTGTLQNAILHSTNFSIIATDAQGIIQVFNAGAVRMFGYAAADMLNKISPADIVDQQQVIARAKALTAKFRERVTSGFESLVFNAMRGNEDNYELTCIRKDGSHFAALVSALALRDEYDSISGYLFHVTENLAHKPAEAEKSLIHHSRKLRSAGPHTLLYIEDNPANIQLVEQFTARQPDIRFLTAGNGNSGLIISCTEKPDVILLDINLPDMSGFKVLDLLHENPITAHIPVIALSGNNLPMNIQSGLQAGFFRYLTKPIKLNELMDALDAALELTDRHTVKCQQKGAQH